MMLIMFENICVTATFPVTVGGHIFRSKEELAEMSCGIRKRICDARGQRIRRDLTTSGMTDENLAEFLEKIASLMEGEGSNEDADTCCKAAQRLRELGK